MIEGRISRGIVAFILALAVVLSGTVNVCAKETGSAKELFNEAELDPVKPKSSALDSLLDEMMEEIVDGDGDTYGQVKDCYDYFVDNMKYGSHMSMLNTPVDGNVTCGDIYNKYGEVEGFGAVALTANQGMCNAYASGFILMVRKLGLQAALVKGQTKGAGGRYVQHQWAEITIDGQVFLFDPQLEQNLSAAGLPAYSVFCKTYDEVPGRYIK